MWRAAVQRTLPDLQRLWFAVGRRSSLKTIARWLVVSLLVAASGARAESSLLAAGRYEGDAIRAGVFVDVNFQSRDVGYAILGELGGKVFAVETFDRRWILLWDGLVSARAGALANTYPFLILAGGRIEGAFEGNYRFLSQRAWAPYLGGHLDASLQVLAIPGKPLSDFASLNASDGVGGITAGGRLQISGGASWLTRGVSLLLGATVQERLRTAGQIARFAALTEFGLRARIDALGGYSGGLEFFGGIAPTWSEPSLNRTNSLSHIEARGYFRKDFANRLWLEIAGSWGQDSHRVEYLDSKTVFTVRRPGTISAFIFLGFNIWSCL